MDFERLGPRKTSSRAGTVRFMLKRYVRGWVPEKDQDGSPNGPKIMYYFELFCGPVSEPPLGPFFEKTTLPNGPMGAISKNWAQQRDVFSAFIH